MSDVKKACEQLKQLDELAEKILNDHRDLLIPVDRNTLYYISQDAKAIIGRIDPPEQWMMHTERKRY